jgi:hypothetical protein
MGECVSEFTPMGINAIARVLVRSRSCSYGHLLISSWHKYRQDRKIRTQLSSLSDQRRDSRDKRKRIDQQPSKLKKQSIRHSLHSLYNTNLYNQYRSIHQAIQLLFRIAVVPRFLCRSYHLSRPYNSVLG